MNENIPLKDIYQQNLNFLIGSGASHGLFPTLWLPIKDSDNNKKTETFETLVTKLEARGMDNHIALMFMFYYDEIIDPVLRFDLKNMELEHQCDGHEKNSCDIHKKSLVIKNYKAFIESLVLLLNQKNDFSRRCNIFTTNYDGCFPFIADNLMQQGNMNFIINDGTRGFFHKTLSARNLNSYICQTGIFGSNAIDIPQINLINLHGSAYWIKKDEQIQVCYQPELNSDIIPNDADDAVNSLRNILLDNTKSTEDVFALAVEFPPETLEQFWSSYKKLPIVNPTKWKFHETVFEEHYYQMLRLLSYELERPNSVLITFGFSFADEHIFNLVKRSLSNPRLQMCVCCFNIAERTQMEAKFGSYRNVKLISIEEGELDFSTFNSKVFNSETLRGDE